MSLGCCQDQDAVTSNSLLQRHAGSQPVKGCRRRFQEGKQLPAVIGTEALGQRLQQRPDAGLELPAWQLEAASEVRNANAAPGFDPGVDRHATCSSKLGCLMRGDHVCRFYPVATELRA